jgi:hypothetical protein
MGFEPWSIWNSTALLEASASSYLLQDGETIYYCYGCSTGPENSTVVLKITANVTPLGINDFVVSNGARGGNATAYVNVTAAEENWFLAVVSGINEKGDYVAGISTFYLSKGGEFSVPVLIHLPQRNEAGNYTLYAAVYRLDEYPNNFIAISKPRICRVS